jgi:hypothetical protein
MKLASYKYKIVIPEVKQCGEIHHDKKPRSFKDNATRQYRQLPGLGNRQKQHS